MAFQTGTRVDPRLGALDFSGFTNAANIQAQGMMNLGESIGKGIEKYQKNKQITAKGLAELEVFGVTYPKLLTSLRESEGEVAKALEAIESGDYKQRDVLTVNGAAKIAVSNALEAQTARLKALEEQINLQKLNPGPITVSDQGIVSQDGRYKAMLPGQKSAVDIAKTEAQTAQIEAETAAIGQPKALDALDKIKIFNQVGEGEVTFSKYLQELMQTKAIKGGELHQKGIFNLDEKQIAAFDVILRDHPEFLEGMPQAVKDYYGASNVNNITLSDGSNVSMKPM